VTFEKVNRACIHQDMMDDELFKREFELNDIFI
jgi:hypothetical protein